MAPSYNLEKIKFATDRSTFEKAIDLYDSGKISNFQKDLYGYSAVVSGSSPYNVFISDRHYDEGDCTCYLGQNDTLCKHMVAVAIMAVKGGKSLSDEDKKDISDLKCSGKIGELPKDEFSKVKKSISGTMRYIKPYNGPSKIWFAYQDSLQEGCNRLSAIISDLPVSKQTANLLIDFLLRLDDKLCRGGIDDSDGTVGGFIEQVVNLLKEYAIIDSNCTESFHKLENRETCFGWEEPLLKVLEESKK